MEWISIKDRLPENDQKLIIWNGSIICAQFFGSHSYQYTRIENGIRSESLEIQPDTFLELKNDCCIEDALENISHWMPLPKPPVDNEPCPLYESDNCNCHLR